MFSKQQIDYIVSKYQSTNCSANSLAKELNCSDGTIRYYLTKNNIPIRGKTTALRGWSYYHKQALREKICQLYISGVDSTKIPEIVNVPYTTVRYILDSSGIEKRPKNQFDGYQGYRKYTIDENYFECIGSSDKAYILGLIFTDGHLDLDDKYTLAIGLSKKDIALLETVREKMGSNTPIAEYTDERYEKPRFKAVLKLSSKKLVTDLLQYGLTQNKSLTIEFPTNLNDQFMASFILGCMDGDGGWWGSQKEPAWGIVSASPKFIAGIKSYMRLVLSLSNNVISVETKYSSTRIRKHPLYNLRFSGFENCGLIYSYLYKDATMWLSRKRDRIENILNNKIVRKIGRPSRFTKEQVTEMADLHAQGFTYGQISSKYNASPVWVSRLVKSLICG